MTQERSRGVASKFKVKLLKLRWNFVFRLKESGVFFERDTVKRRHCDGVIVLSYQRDKETRLRSAVSIDPSR